MNKLVEINYKCLLFIVVSQCTVSLHGVKQGSIVGPIRHYNSQLEHTLTLQNGVSGMCSGLESQCTKRAAQ